MPPTPTATAVAPDPARQREAALREILDLISRSREDAAPVFDAILHRAADLCGADGAALILGKAGDAHQRMVAHYGDDPATVALYDRGEVPMDPDISFVAEAILTGKVVHVDDLMDTDRYRRGVGFTVSTVRDSGIRTTMLVPLMTATGAIGAFGMDRKEVRPFSTDEIALVETFAAQAVIAIENVRQFSELQTRLAREAATREILEVISQSRDDDRPVFDVILRNATRLCGADTAALFLGRRDDPRMTLAAWRESNAPSTAGDAAFIASVNATDLRMDPALHASARAIVSGEVVHILDASQTEGYLSGEPSFRIMVDTLSVRTFLSVPLIDPQGALGVLTLHRREVRGFDDDEIALVRSFAAQAVIAIENVRQFRELQTRLAREAATREILSVISQSRDDNAPVFDMIAQRAAGLCGAAVCTFWRVEDGLIHYCASHGLDSAAFEEMPLTPPMPLLDTTVTGQVVKTRAVVRIEDAMAESYHDHEWARAQGLKQMIGVPIFAGDKVWGSINLMWPVDRASGDADIQLVESFADQASIAIENVRQFRELQDRLAREAATRNILRVISESPDDEQPTFEAILDSAIRLCGTQYASLVLGRRGDASQRMVAHRADIAETLALFREGKVPMDPEDSIAARAILEGRTIHVPDMADTDQYRAGHERFRLVVDRLGLRTNLFVPLLGPDGGIGCFILWKKEVAPFTADQITLMETFASHAVIAIENVRQFRELQMRLEREAALREILSAISKSTEDEKLVFDTVLKNAVLVCGADQAALLLVNDARSHVRLAAQCGYIQKAFETGNEFLIDPSTSVIETLRTAKVVHYLDYAETEQYKNRVAVAVSLVEIEGIRTRLVIPLLRGGIAIGTIALSRRVVRPFSYDEIALVETFAEQAVIAIENVRQFKALEALNAELGHRVQAQVGEIERMGRLKRFLPAAVADAVISSGSEKMLSSHRALLGVLFCDMRGFTAFCETAEPEETIEVLQTYHEEMGRLINDHGAGVDHRMGDGIMVLFNDPLPCDDPAGTAVRLAVAMRDRMAELCARWKKMGHRLGFGVGIALGYANVGMVGSGGRQDYTASGTAVNLAKRLCDEALDGEILISPRARMAVDGSYAVESRGERSLKGIREPVELFSVTGVAGG